MFHTLILRKMVTRLENFKLLACSLKIFPLWLIVFAKPYCAQSATFKTQEKNSRLRRSWYGPSRNQFSMEVTISFFRLFERITRWVKLLKNVD